MLDVTWASRSPNTPWPGATTELLFLGAELVGEMAELEDATDTFLKYWRTATYIAILKQSPEAKSIDDEAADVAMYVAMLACVIGSDCVTAVIGHDYTTHNTKTYISKPSGRILNQAKKCFRDVVSPGELHRYIRASSHR